MGAKFEVVSKFANSGIEIPVRKTKNSAGYDLAVAQDTIVPSYKEQERKIFNFSNPLKNYTLSEMSSIVKKAGAKPTLVSTGLKCKLDPDTYLELSVRSSTPLKYWIVLANGVGIIDADYYNNPDNEGEIFLQLINLSPCDILLQKGDIIGQAIIKPYLTTEDDIASGDRIGGFGSTSE